MSCPGKPEEFGFHPGDLEVILAAIRRHPEIERAVIFGSRAKGTQRLGSDVDIALFGAGVGVSTVAALAFQLQEESPLPYRFDVVDYTHCSHQALRAHIDRVGKTIYIAPGSPATL